MLTAVHRGNEGWNLHASSTTERSLSGDKQRFPMNPVLCFIGQMDVGVYGVKPLKANTSNHCQNGPGWSIMDDGIYQQDNGKCHTFGRVRAWFEEHQDEFTVLPGQQTHLT
ncbi:hypothetical protein TNCV_4825511 [Trichonephila clavipes]|uniref:Uncharacterized protein n=1 Tax=Trichonephila clavipes TaxID=2585209 RepID=A0A8X6UWL1_TRICX|nr:hypothetical protein TNCV_4825511 [Trichonephila clavipes]